MVVGIVAVCSTRVALLLPVKYLVRIGICLLLPAGAHDVSAKLKQLSAPLLSVATEAGPGLPAFAGRSRCAADTPSRRGVRLPLPSGYAAVAAA